jgi:hypothetical protein
MIYSVENWELVQRLRADKQALMDEYTGAANRTLNKVNALTKSNKMLFDKPMSVLPYIWDTRLWTADEKIGAKIDTVGLLQPPNPLPVGNTIVQDFPCIRQFFWASLLPGGKINPHVGVNGILYKRIPDHYRIQICWFPGTGAAFHVQDRFIEYKEDACFGFEDGNELHWVEHHGDQIRTTLILDVWRDQVPALRAPHPDAVLKS